MQLFELPRNWVKYLYADSSLLRSEYCKIPKLFWLLVRKPIVS